MTINRIDQLETDPIDTICLTIVAPEHGGITVYESLNGEEARPKFSGNLAEAVKYLELRMGKILRQPGKEPHVRELPGPAASVRTFSDIKKEINSGRSYDLTENG